MMSTTGLAKVAGHIRSLTRTPGDNSLSSLTSLPMSTEQYDATIKASQMVSVAILALQAIGPQSGEIETDVITTYARAPRAAQVTTAPTTD